MNNLLPLLAALAGGGMLTGLAALYVARSNAKLAARKAPAETDGLLAQASETIAKSSMGLVTEMRSQLDDLRKRHAELEASLEKLTGQLAAVIRERDELQARVDVLEERDR